MRSEEMSARADGNGRVIAPSNTSVQAPAIATNTEKRPKGRGGKRVKSTVISENVTPLPASNSEMLAKASGDGSAIYQPLTTQRVPAIPNHADTIAAIRALGRQRRFLIKSITASGNSAGAYARTLLGWRLDMPEAERAKIAKRAAKMVAAIRKGVETDEPMAATIAPVIMASHAGQAPLTKLRDHTELEMEKLARALPVYPFAKAVKGFGDLALAVVVSEAGDVGAYKSRSALWKRLGLAVIDGERQGRRTSAEEAARHGYNPHRRAEMYAVVAKPLLQHQWAKEQDDAPAHPTGPYGERYAVKKAEYMARVEATRDLPYNDKAKWTPKRADSAARRYMTKCLLRDLYGAWKDAARVTAEDRVWAEGEVERIEREKPALHELRPGETLREFMDRREKERDQALDELVQIAQDDDMVS